MWRVNCKIVNLVFFCDKRLQFCQKYILLVFDSCWLCYHKQVLYKWHCITILKAYLSVINLSYKDTWLLCCTTHILLCLYVIFCQQTLCAICRCTNFNLLYNLFFSCLNTALVAWCKTDFINYKPFVFLHYVYLFDLFYLMRIKV